MAHSGTSYLADVTSMDICCNSVVANNSIERPPVSAKATDIDLQEIFNTMKRSGYPIQSVEELKENFASVLAEAKKWAEVEELRCLERQQEAEREHREILDQMERAEIEIRRVCEMAQAEVDNEYNELISRVSAATRGRIIRMNSRTERLCQSHRMLKYYATMSQSLVENGSSEAANQFVPALNRAMHAARAEHESIEAEIRAEELAEIETNQIPSIVGLDFGNLLESLRLSESQGST